jgi:hypothetical protein
MDLRLGMKMEQKDLTFPHKKKRNRNMKREKKKETEIA